MDSLTNYDMSDREVLHVINDCLNGSGWAEMEDIKEQLKLSATNPALNISSRLYWMGRYGWVIRDKDEARYRLSRIGRDLMEGNVDRALVATLQGLDHGARVVFLHHIGRAYRRAGGPVQHMLRRQWQHDTRRGQKR